MDLRSRLVLVHIILVLHLAFVAGEIHRARGVKSKLGIKYSSTRPSWPPGADRVGPPPALENSDLPIDPDPIYVERAIERDEVEEEAFGKAVRPPRADHDVTKQVKQVVTEPELTTKHTGQQWLLSLASAVLVGMSGIFPLLVIPIETGQALRHGAGAARLQLLLSFAVGGLLGDVFLHLLPEAWAHLEPEDHEGHLWIGIWIILGLLAFLLVEKIFPDDGEEEEKEEETNCDTHEECHQEVIDHGYELSKKGFINGHLNGHMTNGYVANGDVTNGYIKNGAVKNVHLRAAGIKNKAMNGNSKHSDSNNHIKTEQHIKTTGWLNLTANIVDNFTHGLAVAGSYCVSTKVGLLTTLTVLLHEVPHEIGDFAILLRSGFNRWQAAKAQLLTATGGLVGAFCALMADSAQAAGDRTAWVLPFTSGGFIYIALVTVVPDLLKEKNPRESVKQLVLLVCGILVMMLITLLC